jgi:uncharacterized protein DUF2510
MRRMTPPAWYPDPSGAHQLRWFDGRQWTDNVSDQGVVSQAPLAPPPPAQQAPPVQQPQYVQQQSAQQPFSAPVAAPAQAPTTGGGTIFTEPILVIDRQYNAWNKTLSWTIHDAVGRSVASAAEQEPSEARKVLNFVSPTASLFQTLSTKHAMVTGANGNPIFLSDRPNVFSGKPCLVHDPAGNEIGRLTKGTQRGRMFDLWAPAGYQGCVIEQPVLTMLDASGTEVVRMTEMPHGSMVSWGVAGQHYVLHVDRELDGVFGVLVIAAILYFRV